MQHSHMPIFKGLHIISYYFFIPYYVSLTVGVRIASIARVACTRCLLGQPTFQLPCLMTQPRQLWRRPITWPVASAAGPPGTWGWLTNLLVGAETYVGSRQESVINTKPRVSFFWPSFHSLSSSFNSLILGVCFSHCSQRWVAGARESSYSARECIAPPLFQDLELITCFVIMQCLVDVCLNNNHIWHYSKRLRLMMSCFCFVFLIFRHYSLLLVTWVFLRFFFLFWQINKLIEYYQQLAHREKQERDRKKLARRRQCMPLAFSVLFHAIVFEKYHVELSTISSTWHSRGHVRLAQL